MFYKSYEKCFLSHLKSFLFLRFLIFCLEIIGHARDRINKTTKFNFKMDNNINWKANNYNTHNDQYLQKQSQADKEV